MAAQPNPLDVAVRGLYFKEDRRELLRGIPPARWPRLLEQTDESRLTLPLAIRCAGFLPESVRSRVEGNLTNNGVRYARLLETYREIARVFDARGVEFVALKGITHWPLYCEQPWCRPQYDLDLYCLPASIGAASEALHRLGYKSVGERGSASDHLPAMIREGSGVWRGDYYAADLPMPVELHFRLWHPSWERFEVTGADRFWSRRIVRDIGGLSVPCLHPIDGLTFACWHVVRHLLRGALRIYHVYELAHFLDRTMDDDEFWNQWRESGAKQNRIPETIALRLAVEWFGCGVNPVAQSYLESLPPAIVRWFNLYGTSPREAAQSHKHELFLHLCLLHGRGDRWRVAMRRAFPKPRAQHATEPLSGAANRLQRARLFVRRVGYHLRALPRLARGALRWWRASNRAGLFE